MIVVYIAHKFTDNPIANLKRVGAWVAATARIGYVPECSWFPMVLALDDKNPAERAAGIECNKELILRCDQLWLCGQEGDLEQSYGMQQELHHALLNRIRIRNMFTESGFPETMEMLRRIDSLDVEYNA